MVRWGVEEGWVSGCGVLVRREGGAGVLPQKRRDWTSWRQNWLTTAGPYASHKAALCGRGGPLRGKGGRWGNRDGRYGQPSAAAMLGLGGRAGSSRAAIRPAWGTRQEWSAKSTSEKRVSAPAWWAEPRCTGTACSSVATPRLTCLGLGSGSG